jgi:iron complex transport system substrate-binding protein
VNSARTFRRISAALLIGTFAITATACGSADDEAGQGGDAVTVRHSRGETTVHGAPKRIVALGNQWVDAVQALGVTPVGYLSTTVVLSGGQLPPWETPALKDAKQIAMGGKLDEQIAALNPDLILVPSFGIDDPTYEKLKGVAPVIPALTKLQVDPWTDQITTLGRVLHKEPDASKVITDVNGKIDAVAKDLPTLKGKSYIFCFLNNPSQLMVLADPKDGASTLFARLGMSTPQWVVDESKGAGRVQFSAERLGDLKSDLLIATAAPGNEDNYRKTPGFSTLPAVQKNSQIFADMILTGGINEPTALAVPYVLEKLKPTLVNAAK